jgi:hypothetical protein
MTRPHRVVHFLPLLVVLVVSAVFGSAVLGPATAGATGLDDYRWERRPFLVFAPTAEEPQLVETLRRIEASRCEFAAREMVLGVVVAEGTSTLDGRPVSADDARGLASRFGIDLNAVTALLIGKDGGVKRRVSGIPDMPAIYSLIDGMPMRGQEMTASPGRC